MTALYANHSVRKKILQQVKNPGIYYTDFFFRFKKMSEGISLNSLLNF
jgi:hypothetical protein